MNSTKGSGIISVIIPIYNAENTITAALNSISRQTEGKFEIIVVNDGSTDNSLTEVYNFKKAYPELYIIIIDKPHEGVSATRNTGLSIATGNYIAFLDADDMIAPDYYQKALQVLKHYPNVFFVGSFVQYFGDTNRKWATYTPQPPYTLVHNPVNSSGLVYKRAAFLEAGLNDKKVDYGLEDYESVVHLISKGYNGVVLPEFLFQYRVRGDSMFRKITREKLLYSYKYIAEKHRPYYTTFATQINNLLNANGPGFLFDNPTFAVTVVVNPENNSWLFRKLKALVKKNKTLKKIALSLKK